MKVDLVFEGGGILGVSFVGAYEALMKKNYEIERCAGTSAGSIISALIIAGYTPYDLKELIKNTNFDNLASKTKLSYIPILGKPLSLINNKGIYNIDIIEEWIDKLLLKKGISSFKDVMINGKTRLKIVAADITDRKLLIFPDDSKYYGINPEDFSVAKAVAMSCSIPLFFTPIKFKKGDKINYIVDGGLISTYPIWIFDVEGTPRYPTLGFKIQDKLSNTSKGKNGLISYIKDLIDAAINKEETTYLRDQDLARTIQIDFDNKTKSTDFNISTERLNYLYNCGFESTKNFLNKWNFIEYVKRFKL